jgi:putative hydrolase of the HAD superfamily
MGRGSPPAIAPRWRPPPQAGEGKRVCDAFVGQFSSPRSLHSLARGFANDDCFSRAARSTRLRSDQHLGVRSRQHALPDHLNLWQQVDARIRDFISDYLKIGPEEAFRIQKDYYRRYGTTLRGLMTEHGLDPDDFLEFVHAIDHSPLEPNPALGAAIERLRGRKLILTNGTRKHADEVMRRFAIHRHFDGIFDIVAAELEPKPRPQIYRRFLAAHGVEPSRAAMFEDLARNLAVPHALGMTTVLVLPTGTRAVFRQDWELEGRDAPHVDLVTDDLTLFLQRIAAERAPAPDRPSA